RRALRPALLAVSPPAWGSSGVQVRVAGPLGPATRYPEAVATLHASSFEYISGDDSGASASGGWGSLWSSSLTVGRTSCSVAPIVARPSRPARCGLSPAFTAIRSRPRRSAPRRRHTHVCPRISRRPHQAHRPIVPLTRYLPRRQAAEAARRL